VYCWFKQKLVWNVGVIYIFKDEFKYVIEKKGLDDGSMCNGIITLYS